mmetsp:Transcript_10175/g.30097  ORF Transcript_10175/g.30097 Transcript_10175/m.30097 type:complete len:259 (-) Transcript_10175:803-1579(-)
MPISSPPCPRSLLLPRPTPSLVLISPGRRCHSSRPARWRPIHPQVWLARPLHFAPPLRRLPHRPRPPTRTAKPAGTRGAMAPQPRPSSSGSQESAASTSTNQSCAEQRRRAAMWACTSLAQAMETVGARRGTKRMLSIRRVISSYSAPSTSLERLLAPATGPALACAASRAISRATWPPRSPLQTTQLVAAAHALSSRRRRRMRRGRRRRTTARRRRQRRKGTSTPRPPEEGRTGCWAASRASARQSGQSCSGGTALA